MDRMTMAVGLGLRFNDRLLPDNPKPMPFSVQIILECQNAEDQTT